MLRHLRLEAGMMSMVCRHAGHGEAEHGSMYVEACHGPGQAIGNSKVLPDLRLAMNKARQLATACHEQS